MSSKRATKEQPRLIVLSAPSGAGKTTLCQMLLKEFPKITLSVSATTRPKRPREKDGIDYYFFSKAAFEKKQQKGEFAEWAMVHQYRYGTPKSYIESRLAEGKHVLFDIDVQGAMSLLKQYPKRVLLIFIHPPSMETLEKRLKRRKSDSSKDIETRLQNAYNELEWSREYDYQVTNENLDRAYQQLKEIIQKECQ